MDALLSHAIAGALGATPALAGAVGFALRQRAKSEGRIADAVVTALEDTRKDMEQTKQLATDALAMARSANDAKNDCEKRCQALSGELNDLRTELRTGRRSR